LECRSKPVLRHAAAIVADLNARTKKLAAAPDDTGQSDCDAVALRLGVAQVYAYRGGMNPAIAQFEAA
jgi:hypothetical protein